MKYGDVLMLCKEGGTVESSGALIAAISRFEFIAKIRS
jgi:hypothetical protein